MVEKSVMANIQDNFAVGLVWFEFGFETGCFQAWVVQDKQMIWKGSESSLLWMWCIPNGFCSI